MHVTVAALAHSRVKRATEFLNMPFGACVQAVLGGHTAVVHQIFHAGVEADDEGVTMPAHAIQQENPQMVECLLRLGHIINLQYTGGSHQSADFLVEAHATLTATQDNALTKQGSASRWQRAKVSHYMALHCTGTQCLAVKV